MNIALGLQISFQDRQIYGRYKRRPTQQGAQNGHESQRNFNERAMTNSSSSPILTGRKIGLARVSTEDQLCDLQINALEAHNCDQVFVERGVSGGIHPQDRDVFKQARAALKEGDTLVVWKIDRLGRSLKGIIDTIDELSQSGIHFVSLTENFATDTATGRAMMQMIGVMAQLERELIRERTIEGLRAAKDRGVKLGPKYKLTDEQVLSAYHMLKAKIATVSDIAHDLGVSRQTITRGFERCESESS